MNRKKEPAVPPAQNPSVKELADALAAIGRQQVAELRKAKRKAKRSERAQMRPAAASLFKRLFESKGNEAEAYLDLLPDSGDVVLVTLKAHLVAEETLFGIVKRKLANPEQLEDARLRFPQLVHLARGLLPLDTTGNPWEGLLKLNALRNALAHNLKPRDVSTRVHDLVGSATLNGDIPLLPTTQSEADLVKYCLACLLAGLHALDRFDVLFSAAKRLSQQPAGDSPTPKTRRRRQPRSTHQV
jgi:hypothetical protein